MKTLPENYYSTKAEKNFEFARAYYYTTIEQENENESKLYEYLSFIASFLFGVGLFNQQALFIDQSKSAPIIIYYLLLITSIVIGFIGRLNIYRFWKANKFSDLQNAENWSHTNLKIDESKDMDQEYIEFRNGKEKEDIIQSLKKNPTSDVYIYGQFISLILSLLLLVLIIIPR